MSRKRYFDDASPLSDEPVKPAEKIEYKFARVRKVGELSFDLVESFCQRLADGMPATATCDFFGIRDAQFQHWRRLGESFNAGSPLEGALEVHGAFVCGMRLALAEWIEHRVKGAQGANPNWYQNLKLLQIRDRTNFSEAPQGGQDEAFDPNEAYL